MLLQDQNRGQSSGPCVPVRPACLPACLVPVAGGGGEGGELGCLALAIAKLADPHFVHHPVPEVLWTRGSGLTRSVEQAGSGED